MGRQRQEIASELAGDIDRYNVLLDSSKKRIQAALAASATSLTDISGIGPITAAMIIGETGNIDRFKSKHHFTSYNATAPVEASSGSKVRHRLNQRGNRKLNWATHVVAISQLRHDTLGRDFRARGACTSERRRRIGKLPLPLGCEMRRIAMVGATEPRGVELAVMASLVLVGLAGCTIDSDPTLEFTNETGDTVWVGFNGFAPEGFKVPESLWTEAAPGERVVTYDGGCLNGGDLVVASTPVESDVFDVRPLRDRDDEICEAWPARNPS